MARRRVLQSAALLGWAFSVAVASAHLSADEPAKTRKVDAGDIHLTVPEAWQKKKTTSQMRVAQFAVPKPGSDEGSAEMVVFYFGGDAGGVNANAQRWIKQFKPQGRKMTITSGKSSQGDYVLVDLSGTWNKPIGPPIQQRSVEAPNSRFLGVILAVKDQGNYFLRLAGPEKTFSANADAFRASFGGDAKTEKEYKLPESE
jgi:hypothetical protein